MTLRDRFAPSAVRDLIDRIARQSPARLAIFAFAGVIGFFTLLLMLPQATASGHSAPGVTALFTATSAVSVTGLTVVPTGIYWSTFGHVVLLIGIKVGGFGVMTLASILGLAVSRRIGLTQKLITASETKTTRLGEVGSLIRVVIVTSTTLEIALALLLTPRFIALRENVGEALWHSLFYAVSAFNNAGFVPTADGLTAHQSDWLLLLPIIIGVFIGSLGFPVILNVLRTLRHTRKRRWSHFSLHTKLTLVTSSLLLLIGSTLFLLTEWSNPATIGGLSGPGKLLEGLMMGVMPRSGGLATFDVSQSHETTWLITDALMFVGGGSASTAGGIKVTTLAVIILAIFAEARGDRDVEAYGRRIPPETLRLAVAVVFIGATTILITSLVLLQISGSTLDRVLFESISAFGTVGLSTGLSAELPPAGQYVLAALMFVGRTGTMTVAAALAIRERRRVIRLPEERPIIG
ncbi:potassium transporter TrkG [Rarobacter faecitabidus]|uniref:Trk-type K+ transport system membrane component n=1 Tax=Rarobacter faecitabidus TaxID=13243 RepID=A0A542ZTT7_RARFA|nr:potassium transporter TrkG [Rarobacter faecitabidus]TQL63773.1 Trk-type K+ transport system membrane component [Rarobacter faecitabidus]